MRSKENDSLTRKHIDPVLLGLIESMQGVWDEERAQELVSTAVKAREVSKKEELDRSRQKIRVAAEKVKLGAQLCKKKQPPSSRDSSLRASDAWMLEWRESVHSRETVAKMNDDWQAKTEVVVKGGRSGHQKGKKFGSQSSITCSEERSTFRYTRRESNPGRQLGRL